MRRREFMAVLGGAAATWPLAARAQQAAMPVIGFLNPASPDAFADRLRAFCQGLKDSGYVEGENVAIAYRWAEGQLDRLPALAADLVRRQVAVIASVSSHSTFAAKAATTSIPIIFSLAKDPVRLGLIACKRLLCGTLHFLLPGGGHPHMNRREFITLLGGAAAAWPLAARAQQGERMQRIGVLMNTTSADQQANLQVFLKGLQQLGWIEGQNMRIETRWAEGDAGAIRRYAGELVALAPDVILATGTAAMGPLLQATRTIPIVFNSVADPVGAGFVKSMARPGGNTTGFIQFEYSLSGKWPELLKQIAPSLTRVAVLRDAAITSGIGQFAVIQSVAPSLRMEVSAINVRDPAEIEGDIADFARMSNGGLILTASALSAAHGELIIALAAQHKLPAVYYRRGFVADGGLISYGYDLADQYRRAAGYVDRILRGAKPADLPVQAPTKYELVINLKTAKALGLDVPDSLLARADEVIE